MTATLQSVLALEVGRAGDGYRAADGRNRVSQLVGEHGQELVLAPIGVDQPRLGHLPRRDVFDRAHMADGPAGLAFYGTRAHM